VVIGCGPIEKVISHLAGRGVNVIGVGSARSEFARRSSTARAPPLSQGPWRIPAKAVRDVTEGGRGADSVIEAWARRRRGNGRSDGPSRRHREPVRWLLSRHAGPGGPETRSHYSEITIKSTFHHTPHFIREALEAIARGEIRSSDFVNAEIPLNRTAEDVWST